MLKNTLYISLLFISLVLISPADQAEALSIDPFEYFNVYSLGDIGQEEDKYNSDIEGTIGAAGDVYFQNFGAPNLPSNDYVLHTGGDFSIQSGGMQGVIDAGGDVSIANYRVTHDIYAGGNATIPQTTSGATTATVRVAGTVDQFQWNNINTVAGSAYTAVFDFNEINEFFTSKSSEIGGMTPTGTIEIKDSTVYINAVSGVNVFNVDISDIYENMTGIIINGPADAIVYINALDEDATLGWSLNWDYEGGITAGDVILNFPNALTLDINGGEINVLAPFADTTFDSGAINGNLIAGNLFGGAQVNEGYFDGDSNPIPEPSTLILLGSGIAGLIGFRKRSQS